MGVCLSMNKWSLYFTLGLVVSLVGCGKYSDYAKDSQIPSMETWPLHYKQKIDDHLFVDADVQFTVRDTYHVYEATKYRISTNEAIKVFRLDKDEIVVKYQSEYGEFALQDMDESVEYYGILFYNRRQFRKNYSYILEDKLMIHNYAEEFEFGSLIDKDSPMAHEYEEANKYVREITSALGIDISDTPYVSYYLSKDDLSDYTAQYLNNYEVTNMEQLPEKIRFKDTWTELDEIIYMIWNMEIDGIPIISDNYSNNVSGDSMQEAGTSVIATYSRTGLLGMNIGRIYKIERDVISTKQLISPEDAIKKLEHYYRNTLLYDDLTFTKISLVYAPYLVDYEEELYQMSPTWILWGTQKVADQMKGYLIKVNAVTGEIM